MERPATLCIPLLLATFSLSYGSRTFASDFFALRTDFWLTVYWVLLTGTLTYLLVFGSRALLVLLMFPRSRNIANLYLVASASGMSACVVRVRSCGDSSVPRSGGCRAGLVLRLHVWRRFRADLCELLAAEAQVVSAAGGALPSLTK